MEKQSLPRFERFLEGVERVIGIVTEVLLAGVLVTGTWGILARYLPIPQPIWLSQMGVFLGMWMYFLGFILAAKGEEYIFIEYLDRFFSPRLRAALDFVFHLGMITFSVVVVVAGWPLQVLQSRMMVTSFPLPQNTYSLSVLVSFALIVPILLYYAWVRLKRLLALFGPEGRASG